MKNHFCQGLTHKVCGLSLRNAGKGQPKVLQCHQLSPGFVLPEPSPRQRWKERLEEPSWSQRMPSFTQNSRNSQVTLALTVAKAMGVWVNLTVCHRKVTSNTAIICFFTHLISLAQLRPVVICPPWGVLGWKCRRWISADMHQPLRSCCIFPP